MIPKETESDILRLFHAEKWRVGTISNQLRVHHTTVQRVLRLKTLPGEQAQVDWAHFGKHQVGRAERILWAFVVVLSYSRQVFLRFFLGASMPFFVRGHVDAFAFFGGVPRVLLYDNLKSA